MTKAELESKSLSDLHGLAAKAGIERYRMLPRPELVAKLAGSESGGGSQRPPRSDSGSGEQRERPPRRRRSRGGRKPTSGNEGSGREGSGREGAREPRSRSEQAARPETTPPPVTPSAPPTPAAPAAEPSRPRRRRRRFGRRGKQEGIGIQDLLLPPAAGRQAIVCAETREGCTALLRGIAADLSGDSNGPDPVVLLIDPGPEELADWKRAAPQAEIVAAGQARHASDALAQATARANSGDAVMLLVDSLTRLAAAYGDADSAKEFFDAGRVQAATGTGSLTVVVALERPASN
jgi:transcription termination factor Rho